MASSDIFAHFDIYSKIESQLKLKHFKSQREYSFIEEYLRKKYEVYKKNKNSNISFSDYRNLMLQELVKNRKWTANLNHRNGIYDINANLLNYKYIIFINSLILNLSINLRTLLIFINIRTINITFNFRLFYKYYLIYIINFLKTNFLFLIIFYRTIFSILFTKLIIAFKK